MTLLTDPMLKSTISLLFVHSVAAFQFPASNIAGSTTFLRTPANYASQSRSRAKHIKDHYTASIATTSLAHHNDEEVLTSFDPFRIEADDSPLRNPLSSTSSRPSRSIATTTAASTAILPLVVFANTAVATAANLPSVFSSGEYNPDNFKPVCAVSDSFYRVLQGTTQAIVGEENFVEYGPLIAGGLLRIRLELCVVESFFNEAVGPFIKQNGVSWILPLHETVETFLAGTIFAVATTFILVGSTKIVSVVITYGDVFVGVPCRLLGGFVFDRALGKPVTLEVGVGPWKKQLIGPDKKNDEKSSSAEEGTQFDLDKIEAAQVPLLLVSGAVKAVGETSKVARELIEGADFFVGRYLTLLATGYVFLKFVHFKVFPDFPPF